MTMIAVNRDNKHAQAQAVIEKPLTMLAPNVLPKNNKIKHVIRVEIFESRMEGQARLQPRSMA